MGLLSIDQVKNMGFAGVGKDVKISDRASFYNCKNIVIGDYSRIDDFCVLSAGSGGIRIGRNVHVAIFSSLVGKELISLKDFCNISSRVSIYSSSDDYSGMSMTNPTVPEEFTDVHHSSVMLERHVIVGCGSVILPGVTLKEGVAIGALSLVNRDCETFGIYAGNPVRRLKDRKRDLLSLEQKFLSQRDI